MTLTQMLLVLRARWLTAVAVMLGVVTLVLAVSLLLPRQYAGTAAVVLDVKSPDPIAGVVLPGLSGSGYMATQIDVLKSERVALRAIRALELDKRPELRQRWQEATEGEGEFDSWLSDMMLAKLEAKPGRDSNVIAVSYTSADPKFAAAMTNAFVKAYIDTTLELRTEPAKRFSSFFDTRSKQARETLEQAQSKLSDYQRKNGIVASDERLDVENSRLSELSTQMVMMQALADESLSRQSQAGANGDRMQEVLNNPLVAGLTTELARQEAKLNEMNARLGAQHPSVQELRANIDNLRARVASETRRVTGSVSVNNSVNQSRVAQLRAALEEQRNKVLKLKGQRDEAAVLMRDVENAQRTYDAVVNRANQTGIESEMTQTNVSVLKQASVPTSPSSPRILLNTAIAIVLGLLLGLGAAIARELGDKRLRSEEDVLLLLRQPLVGVLPVRSRTPLLGGRSRERLQRLRILGSRPLLAR
jgi:succinoglycan biosynthesis transport protein ExoP